MVTLISENSLNILEHLKLLQQRVLLSKDTVKDIKTIAKLNYLKKQLIFNLLEICKDCTKMAALPQGAYMVCKMREQFSKHDLTVSRLKSTGDKNETKFYNGNKKLMEYSPVKYNEKLMNSIWGLYNRYSPHNIKSNEIVKKDLSYNQQQQTTAVANHAIAHNIAMAVTSGMEWTYMKK